MMTRKEFEQAREAADAFVKKYGPGPLKRRRGRPATGVSTALEIAIEVEEHRQAGMTRAAAVKQVAELRQQSRAHISLCYSMVEENDLDRLLIKGERMRARAKKNKGS
jgi:hypothetical protein